MRLTDKDVAKKGELLKFRAELEKDIEWLNEEHIYWKCCDDSNITRDVARDVRDKLIEASNIINTFRLRRTIDRE